jgi:antitoxin (DNA-binding transcriptional repressor) of toxin-antitoxin stability system
MNLFRTGSFMATIAMNGMDAMRSVNVAKLKNQLSKYLTLAKAGEEIVIRDRNLLVAKLVPFSIRTCAASPTHNSWPRSLSRSTSQ